MEQEKGKKEDRRVRRTKKMLTQALTHLMQEKQIKEITVRELTDLADMNRGTFYLYYKDIYDMLDQIEDQMFDSLNAIVEIGNPERMESQILPIMRNLFRFAEENQEMCRVLLSPNGDMSFLHRLFDVIRDKCRAAWQSLQAAPSEDDFDYHYSFVVFGCAGLVRSWVNRGCPEPADQMAALADLMIHRGSLGQRENEG